MDYFNGLLSPLTQKLTSSDPPTVLLPLRKITYYQEVIYNKKGGFGQGQVTPFYKRLGVRRVMVQIRSSKQDVIFGDQSGLTV